MKSTIITVKLGEQEYALMIQQAQCTSGPVLMEKFISQRLVKIYMLKLDQSKLFD